MHFRHVDTDLSLWISHLCSSVVTSLLGKFYYNGSAIVLVWQSLPVMCTLVSVSQHVTDCSLQLGLFIKSSIKSCINLESEHIIQINQPTKCNNLSSLFLGVYLQLNMFRASSRPSSGAQQL